MSEPKKTLGMGWILICSLVLLSFGMAPTASAHNCKSYDESECDPNGCVEGEKHYHKHLRYWWEGDDEYCQTEGKDTGSKDPDPEKEKCVIADKEFPRGVCDLINDPRLKPGLPETGEPPATVPRDGDGGSGVVGEPQPIYLA